jgi:hypothetical protein
MIAAPSVTVFDPRLSVLWADMLKGDKAYHPHHLEELLRDGLGNPLKRTVRDLEGRIRDHVHGLGIGIDPMPSFNLGPGPRARTFLIGYAYGNPPIQWTLTAELVAADGTVYPLQRLSCGGGSPPGSSYCEYSIASLSSGVTNYALRLKLNPKGRPLAEIRFPEQ